MCKLSAYILARLDKLDRRFNKFKEKTVATFEELKADWEAVDAKTNEIAAEVTRIAGKIETLLAELAKSPTPAQLEELRARGQQEVTDLTNAAESLRGVAADPVE